MYVGLRTSDTLHKKFCSIGPRLCGTSENSYYEYFIDGTSANRSSQKLKLSLELENGSRIVTLPGTEKTIRGFSGVALLLVDEAARVDDELYYAVRPMLAVSGGSLIMLSTPYGKRGVFFEEWTEGGEWERYEVPASQYPRISEEFLEEERRSKPEWYFAQEYGCEFRETEDQIFSHELITAARDDELNEFTFEGDEDLWS
jgi:phage FluMu gp28-like protein